MAYFELFGFTVGKKPPVGDINKPINVTLPSFVPPNQDDGSVVVAPGGVYGTYMDLEGKAKNEIELVSKYRDMSLHPECDSAIQDIVNEAIVVDDDNGPVEIVLDDIKFSESVKKKIRDEFEYLLRLLDFSNNGYDIFRKWYIDGRIYYHIMIDEKSPRNGIQELRYIDPRKIRKITEPIRKRDAKTSVPQFIGANVYYLYNPTGMKATVQGLKISKDSIAYCHSGLYDTMNSMVLSNLHKAIKPLNQLRMLEDAAVIYRLARAPERRIFYIDVGNLPKMKAEQYLRDMMAKHKNKLVYDASTGEVRDDRKFMTMLEDYWLPRREGGKGTEISTLPGGQNLGEMDDVEYTRKKLYRSLNVPITRMESEGSFNLGRSSEITRDEVKFAKFIKRLRTRFGNLFLDLLEIQLALKGIMSRDDWKKIKQDVFFDFLQDNHYSELKQVDIMRERLSILGDVDNYTGKYFSRAWVRKNILKQTEDEIEEIDKQIEEEGSDDEFMAQQQQMDAAGEVAPPDGGGGGPPGMPPASPKPPGRPKPPTGPAGPPRINPTRRESVELPAPRPLAEESDEHKKLVESMTRMFESATIPNNDDEIPIHTSET